MGWVWGEWWWWGGMFPWLHIPGCETIGSLNLDWRFKGQGSEAPQSSGGQLVNLSLRTHKHRAHNRCSMRRIGAWRHTHSHMLVLPSLCTDSLTSSACAQPHLNANFKLDTHHPELDLISINIQPSKLTLRP